MLSTDDVKKFIDLKRSELDREKQKIDAFQPKTYSDVTSETVYYDDNIENSEGDENKQSKEELTFRQWSTLTKNEKDYGEELNIKIYPNYNVTDELSYNNNTPSSYRGHVDPNEQESSSTNQSEDIVNISRLLKKVCGPPLGMLKTGEFSPNHPELALGAQPLPPPHQRDVFLGLGMYEERRKELLMRRQKEYRDYLTKQRNQKALAKQRSRSLGHALQTTPRTDPLDYGHQQLQQDLVHQQSPQEYEETQHRHNLQSFLSPAGGWLGEGYWDPPTQQMNRRPSSVAVQTDDDLQSNQNTLAKRRSRSPGHALQTTPGTDHLDYDHQQLQQDFVHQQPSQDYEEKEHRHNLQSSLSPGGGWLGEGYWDTPTCSVAVQTDDDLQGDQNTLAKQRSHSPGHAPHTIPGTDHLDYDYQQQQDLVHQQPSQDYEEKEHRHNLQSSLSPGGGWLGEGYWDTPTCSVAVQTDDDLINIGLRRVGEGLLTRAERELSPRPPRQPQTLALPAPVPLHSNSNNHPLPSSDWRMLVEKVNIGTQNNVILPPSQRDGQHQVTPNQQYIEALNGVDKNIFRKDSPRARLLQDLRHSYLPSLFDEDAIRRRNTEMEQEAAAKRAAYQQELKKQIDEQHRLREERKAREKLLEEAETRRLEEQLRMLKLDQDHELEKQKQLVIRMRKDSNEFERRRLKIQNDIDGEKKTLRQTKVKPNKDTAARMSRSEPNGLPDTPTHDIEDSRSNLPFYYKTAPSKEIRESEPDILSYNLRRNNPHLGQDPPPKRVPFSTNIPENSVFSESIPVKNYNTDDVLQAYSKHRNNRSENVISRPPKDSNRQVRNDIDFNTRNVVVNRNNLNINSRPNYEPTFLTKNITEMIDTKNISKSKKYESEFNDSLPIPVLREPVRDRLNNEYRDDKFNKNSEAMKNVEDKWKVPAVQKNILKNNFTEDGKQENILTQLGSIRRQLQLEQLKLDQSLMFPKSKMVK